MTNILFNKTGCLSYIAYFYSNSIYTHSDDAIVLCVSDEPWKCRYYCERIRHLNKEQYEVREVLLDEASRISMFEDYLLEEFDDEYLFLTNQDILYLMKEVDSTMDKIEEQSASLRWYASLISKIPQLKSDSRDISEISTRIENHISSVHSIKSICREIYRQSVVFSNNIYEYLNSMKVLQYDREMTEQYTWKLMDPKS